MSDGKRIALAALLSVLLHVAVLWGGVSQSPAARTAQAARAEPIVLNLRPPAPRQVVETVARAQAPPDLTDLISDRNAQARDMVDTEGLPSAPHVEAISGFDDPGSARRPPLPPDAVQPTSGGPEQSPEASPSEGNLSPQNAPAVEEPLLVAESASGQRTVFPAALDEETPHAKAERSQVAEAESIPLPPAPPEPAQKPRGTSKGGVQCKGFLGFEAMEDEIAPYLLDIQRRVELKWRAALGLRYSGTSPTRAVVECAITPEGKLAYAQILEQGASPSFGALCKEAIETAGPFPAFPFKVPDVYRSKNLDITWTFHFLEE